ncbi:hypothetical protein [Streptomyces sp. NPDC096153]|uniref:hypothetical protein n=1 Tax=Streptomyces sp. NPDC096153 TaxID=3155548 RepID=UPI00331DE4DF
MTPELKAAYRRLEAAIREVAEEEGCEGVMTEWIVVTAHQRLDDEGDGVTQIGRLVPDGGGTVPYHRTMGLLDYALTMARAEIVAGEADG